MKKTIFFLLTISVILFFVRCQRQPDASFSTSQVHVQAGDPVTFSNTSLDGKHYNWDFGDGVTTTETSPVHTYTTPGTYHVLLTAYSRNKKKSSSASTVITVVSPTGEISFWQSGTPSYNITSVTVNGVVRQITADFPDGPPDCETSGCANFVLNTGSYSYTASDGTYAWSGTFDISANSCLQYELN